jgi:hypothetical protein
MIYELDAAGLTVVADILEAVAESARASWGHSTLSIAGRDIARQAKDWAAANPQPPP